MYPECKTYQDVTALYLALGFGCKSCGRLNSISWNECSGDTYCQGCKNMMLSEQPKLKFTEYPHGPLNIEVKYDARSEGFAQAAYQRMDFERIYGYLPNYTGDGYTGE